MNSLKLKIKFPLIQINIKKHKILNINKILKSNNFKKVNNLIDYLRIIKIHNQINHFNN
jgi:hypothetical protein